MMHSSAFEGGAAYAGKSFRPMVDAIEASFVGRCCIDGIQLLAGLGFRVWGD